MFSGQRFSDNQKLNFNTASQFQILGNTFHRQGNVEQAWGKGGYDWAATPLKIEAVRAVNG